MFSRLMSLRRCLSLAAAIAPLTAVAVARPQWASAAGLDVWNMPHYEQQLAVATQETERLGAVNETVAHRITAKEALVAELIAGRATLAETVEQFLALNSDPCVAARLREIYAGDTDEVRTARNVIDYATQRVKNPAARAALADRLAAELAEFASCD